MKTVGELIKWSNRSITTAEEGWSLREAIDALVESRVGALPVVRGGDFLVGIISERDVVEIIQQDTDLDFTEVGDVMTSESLVVALETDSLENALAMMWAARVEHLPIMRDETLVGFISDRDVYAALVSESEVEVRYLKDYIYGSGPLPEKVQHELSGIEKTIWN